MNLYQDNSRNVQMEISDINQTLVNEKYVVTNFHDILMDIRSM